MTKVGSKVKENNHDNAVPMAAAFPNASAGGRSFKLRLKKPTTVVKLVMDTAKKFKLKLACNAANFGLVFSSTNNCVKI